MKKISFLLVSALILIALCSCTTMQEKPSRTVSVSGNGAVSIIADMVTFNIGVTETAPTTGEAQQLANAKISQIISILRDFGVEDNDMNTANLSFYTDYYWQDGKQIKNGEQVSQTIYVSMKNIDRFASLMDEFGKSVSGITFNSVSFTSSDKTDAKARARELAYQDAYEKALSYASSCGLKLGNPITISEGSSYSGSRVNSDAKMAFAVAESTSAFYGTEAPSGQLSVNVSCDITFELN